MAAIDFVHWNVYTADAPAPPGHESWTLQPHLIAETFTEGTSPTLPSLSLRWEFGTMSRAHRVAPDPQMDYVAPLSLQYKYVLLQRDDESKHWIGYIRDDSPIDWSYESDGAGGLRATGGTQHFAAYGLEYFLGRRQICGRSSRQEDLATRPFAYNAGSGDGRDLDQARKSNRKPPEEEENPYAELAFSFEKDAIEWDAAAIVKHLLAEQCPRDNDDEPAPLAYYLEEGAIPYLNWFKPIVRVEGRTILQLLDEIISHRRGLVWWLSTGTIGEGEEQELVAYINVTSMNGAPLVLPDSKVLPAAASIKTLDNPTADYPLLAAPQITRNGARRYHRVRVRGARATTTFSADGPTIDTGVFGYTYSHAVNGQITPLWSSDDQSDYELGVSLTDPDYDALDEEEKKVRNDKFRQSARFERVYRYYGVTPENVAPIINQDTGSTTGFIEAPTRSVRILRTTTLRVGYDYSDVTEPTANGDEQEGEEFLRPMAFTYLPKSAGFIPLTLGDDDGGWRRMHELGSHTEHGFDVGDTTDDAYDKRFNATYSITPIAGEPGFILHGGGLNHSLRSSLINEEFAVSKFPAVIAWPATLVTVTTEWDSYCEAVWPVVPPEASPIEELLIQIGERARFDYVNSGTVYDLTPKGELKQVATGGAVRDDRTLCAIIAALAYNWYSSERATVQLNFRGGEQPLAVGDLLTTIGSGAVQQTVNATVSQITYNLESGAIQLNCGYPEIDFSTLA